MVALEEHYVQCEPEDDGRGLVLLQIDGLSYDTLARAMEEGYAPNLSRLAQSEDYDLSPFFSGIPAETLPVLNNIFYGERIPANDWYSKARGEHIDSIPYEAEVRERAAERGELGLMHDGATYLSPICGGAEKVGITVSTLKEEQAEKGMFRTLAKEAWNDIKLIWRSDESITGTLYNLVRDFFSSRSYLKEHDQWNSWWDQHYPYLITMADNVFPTVATEGVKEAMEQGLPVAYVDYTSYDERAHFYGTECTEALESLSIVDKKIGEIVDKVEREGLQYDIVVLSDHGQTPSVQFKEIFGKPIQEAIYDMAREADPSTDVKDGDIQVAHAYSMANVYFDQLPGTASLADVKELYPGLVDALVQHPSMGFVVGRTDDGIVVQGREGSVSITQDGLTVEGDDPLAPYGDTAFLAEILRDYSTIDETGDLVLVSTYAGDRIIDFNDVYSMVSLHGGLGGPQTRPFILAPRKLGLDVDETTVPMDLYEPLKRLKERHSGADA
ncbi:MAG: alkaline phosphatase family protein [Candidatus Undinarchaeales archaeon]|jgi:hypothetical protein|nr:alkaline phosphatase family protein [Candidatus Undinarchaeales archaeon]MDP7494243.1 alkaline phosphatase family protein [Candidatus Undinarchaeales archaeon]